MRRSVIGPLISMDFRVDSASLERLTRWLLKTQDPSGVWGYQGTVATGSQRVQQTQTGCSMLAAGLGSVLICADLLDAVPESTKAEVELGTRRAVA